MVKRTILVVEQDPSMQHLYEAIFRRHQGEFTCHIVQTGEAALKFLEQQPVDLLLLATDLPRISGIDVLQLVRAGVKTKDLPVILLSPQDDPAERLTALQRGADHYQSKAFGIDEFLARLRRLVKRSSRGPLWTAVLSLLCIR